MKVVVLAGGLSTERDVSIISGTKVCEALRARGHKAILLDVFLGYPKEYDIHTIFDKKDSLIPGEAGIQAEDPDIEKIKKLRTDDISCFFGPNVIEICKAADIVYMGLHGADGENGKVQAAFDVLGIRYTGSGYLGSALAMESRCACPSEKPPPRSFTTLWIPSGSCSTKSHAQASFRASTISSSVASGFTFRIFSAMVPENMVFP